MRTGNRVMGSNGAEPAGIITKDEALQLRSITSGSARLTRALTLKQRAGQAVVTNLDALRRRFPGRTAVYRPSAAVLYQAMTKVTDDTVFRRTGRMDGINKALLGLR